MRPPIFIIGNPRSGTTLLRLMLTCHGDIVIPPECGFAVWFHSKYRDWRPADANLSGLGDFMRDLLSARKIEHWKLNERELYRFLRQESPSSYPELISCVYVWYGISQGRSFKRWGDKNNFHIRHILTIKAMFPSTSFIHLVRDGRDVACSYKRLSERKIDSPYAPRLPGRIEDTALQWKTNVEIATQSFASVGPENVHEVRFEDLVSDTRGTLQELCRRLGEDYDPAMLEYHASNKSQELEPREFLPWKEKNLQSPIQAEIGRYRRELSEKEIRAFEGIAGKELARFGYLERESS